MPRNGAGVFSLVNNTWFPPVNGVLATATDWTPFITDVQNALTQSVSSDGQTPFTGNLPMGNNKITGLANGTATTDAAAFGQVSHYVGNCRLTKSGSNLLLIPFNGNQLTINGALQTIPAAGVSLAPGAAVALTLYYIYAFMVGAVMTLEFSTTSHSTDVTTGVEIKTGDVTRSLVGMARPIAGPLWQDAINQRFVISWFNQQPKKCETPLGGAATTTSLTYVELSTSLRNEFLCWAGASLPFNTSGAVFNNTANSSVFSALSLDGALNALEGFNQFQSYQANALGGMAVNSIVQPSEGYHYVTLLGAASGGTANWTFSAAIGNRTVVNGIVNV